MPRSASSSLWLLAVLVLCLSPLLLVSADSCGGDCDYYNCGSGYYCQCDYYYNGGTYAECNSKAGEIAGIVIGAVVFVGILVCIAMACRRRRYYAGQQSAGYGGAAYAGQTVQQGGYPAGGAPMQAIPLQYGQPQQAYGGPVYAQQPTGAQYPPQSYAASAPPTYTETPYGGQPAMSEPYKTQPQYSANGSVI